MSDVRGVLLLSYFFPPSTTVGGLRTYGFARQLAKRNYPVTVVTCANRDSFHKAYISLSDVPKGITIVGVTDLLLKVSSKSMLNKSSGLSVNKKRNFLYHLKNNFLIPDPQIFWALACIFRLVAMRLTGKKYRVVLSSAGPLSSHIPAVIAKFLFGAVLITDFRDLMNYEQLKSERVFWWKAFIDEKIRRIAMFASRFSVTISDGMTARLGRSYPYQKIISIKNGYLNPSPFVTLAPTGQDSLSMVFAGTFYPDEENIGPLAVALTKFKNINPIRVSFDFFSDLSWENKEHLENLFAKSGARVTFKKPYADRDKHATLAAYDVQVICQRESCDYALPVKMFEYLSVGRPILCLSKSGTEIDRVLPEYYAPNLTSLDSEEIVAFLLRAKAYNSTEQPVRTDAVAKFSRDFQSAVLVDEIEREM